ncbi:MAG: hypothetical protein MI920_34885 [Kiloniellales bacterium]|nr:hypothetical protein [Kiloniellales bacterium]
MQLALRLPPRWTEAVLRFHGDTVTLSFVAQAALLVMAVDVVLAASLRLAGLPSGGWVFAVALLAGPVSAHWLRSEREALDRLHLAVLGGLFLFAALISALFYDTSWDGTSYHLPAILEMARGWNPLEERGEVFWANLYPHGIWLLQQTAGQLFGSFEVTKVFQVVFAGIALISLLAWWRVETNEPLDPLRLALIYLIALNPIVTAQVQSFYVDAPLYALSITMISQLFLAHRTGRREHLVAAACACVLLMGSKFSGPYYAGMIALMFGAYLLWCRVPLRRWIVTLGLAGVLGAAVVGFHPFVSQPLETGTYELMDRKELRKTTVSLGPNNALKMPGPVQLAVSLFSRTRSYPGMDADLKLPLTVSLGEIRWMGTPDVRVAGFGPFFSAAMLGAAGLFLVALWRRRRDGRRAPLYVGFLVAVAMATIASVFFPEPWQARWVPLVWAAPLLLLASIEPVLRSSRRMTVALVIVLLLAGINSGLALAGNALRTAKQNWSLHSFIWSYDPARPLTIVPVPYLNYFHKTLEHRFENAGLEVEFGEEDACLEAIYVYHHVSNVC